MNCPQCTEEMVTTRATNFGEEYQYCRTCRKELKEMECLPSQEEEKEPAYGLFPCFGNDHYWDYHLNIDPGTVTFCCMAWEFIAKTSKWMRRETKIISKSDTKHMYDPMTHRCTCGATGMFPNPVTINGATSWICAEENK